MPLKLISIVLCFKCHIFSMLQCIIYLHYGVRSVGNHTGMYGLTVNLSGLTMDFSIRILSCHLSIYEYTYFFFLIHVYFYFSLSMHV